MKKIFLWFIIVVIAFFICFIGLIFFYPEPESFSSIQESSKIYDRNGELLYEILIPEKGKQNFVSVTKISPYLLDAIIAIEDQDFYKHSGVDFSATIRAFWQNFYYSEIISGASTIEQQLARNLLDHKERSYFNKLKEITLAFKLNFKYEKNELLEKYLNTVYFGNLTYGIEAASQTYFAKTSEKLDLAESTFLAGLPQSPSLFSPYVDLTAGKKRQNKVLDALLIQKKISQEQYETALEEELIFQKQRLVSIKAPHFVMWILDQLEKKDLLKNISKGGYKITTTLDLGLQEEIQNLANLHLDKLISQNITNAAVVVLEQKTGEILAMLGSKDYFNQEIDGEVNVALALRQPGSTLKPFLYAMIFEKGLDPSSVIVDEAVQFDSVDGHPYEPKNYDLQYHGKVTLREALAQSLNIPVVKILDYIGVNAFLYKLRELGINTLNQPAEYYGLALALGSGEVSLFELTQAYSVLAREGEKVAFNGLKEITNNNSQCVTLNLSKCDTSVSKLRMIYSITDEMTQPNRVFSSEFVTQVTSIISDNYARTPAFGEDSPLKFNYSVAVKTGTSRNFRDNWALGYTPLRTVGVWVGNSDGSPMINSSGVTGAAPLFHSVMNLVMQDLPKENFSKVENLKDSLSFEAFLKNNKVEDDNQKDKQQELISYPYDGDIFQVSSSIPLDRQVLTFKSKKEGTWFLNGKLIGKGIFQNWQMKRGDYELNFLSDEKKEKIRFAVQ